MTMTMTHTTHSQIKQATDPESEKNFTRSFALLSYQFLQNRAPAVVDNLIGFQLLDKSDDNDKASGAFVAKLGERLIAVPAFFVNNEVKGMDMMWLVKPKRFLPLKENWVNDLLNSRNTTYSGSGTSAKGSLNQLGIKQPLLDTILWPQGGGSGAKYASVQQVKSAALALCEPAGDKGSALAVAEMLTKQKQAGARALLRQDLGDFIDSHDARYSAAALELCELYPVFKAAFARHYGKRLAKSLQTKLAAEERANRDTSLGDRILGKQKAAAAPPPPSPSLWKKSNDGYDGDHSRDIELITGKDNRTDLTEEERNALKDGKQTIRDFRGENNQSILLQHDMVRSVSLCNPTCNGVYEILTKPTDFRKMLVIASPLGASSCESDALVVELGTSDESRPHGMCKLRSLWMQTASGSEAGPADVPVSEWFEQLPGTAVSDLDVGDEIIVVSPAGTASEALDIQEVMEGGLLRVSRAYPPDCDVAQTSGPAAYMHPYPAQDDADRPAPISQVALDTLRGDRMMLTEGTLYAPKGCKIVRLLKQRRCLRCGSSTRTCECENPDVMRYTERRPPILGSITSIQLELATKTAELKIAHDGLNYLINNVEVPRSQAVWHLVATHGLPEKQAHYALQMPALGSRTWRIKHAQGYPLYPSPAGDGGSYMPPIDEESLMAGGNWMYGGAPTTHSVERQQVVPGLQASLTDPMQYHPLIGPDGAENLNDLVGMAQEAEQSGRKELFDLGGIMSLVKAVRPENVVDSDVSDLLNAIDGLAKRLFLLYQNPDAFADRYGQRDLPELEDALRNALDVLGDTALYLKQKNLDGDPLERLAPEINAKEE